MSNHYPRHELLLAVTAASIITNQTSDIFLVRTTEQDEIPGDRQGFKVFFHTEQLGGVTSPTVQAHLETSWDGVQWTRVASSTQLSADDARDEIVPISTLGSHVRVVTMLGGATKPAHKVTARLVSHGRFQVRKAG